MGEMAALTSAASIERYALAGDIDHLVRTY